MYINTKVWVISIKVSRTDPPQDLPLLVPAGLSAHQRHQWSNLTGWNIATNCTSYSNNQTDKIIIVGMMTETASVLKVSIFTDVKYIAV